MLKNGLFIVFDIKLFSLLFSDTLI